MGRMGALRRCLRFLRRNPLIAVGGGLVLFVLVVTIFAEWIAPYGPVEPVPAYFEDPLYKGEPPSWAHPFGTNKLGYDMLSRVIYGGRVPLLVAGVATALSLLVGVLLGWLSGYFGGLLDRALSLVMDAMYSFPALILAIAIVAVLGPGIVNMVVAIFIVYIPTYFRVVRGQVLQVREMEFVEAGRAIGLSHARILFKHIAPNTITSVLAIVSFNVADAILTEAALSFLGLGLPPTVDPRDLWAADWGADVQAGQLALQSGQWWLITFPGLMIVVVSLGFGLLGEGINDWLNPRRRRV